MTKPKFKEQKVTVDKTNSPTVKLDNFEMADRDEFLGLYAQLTTAERKKINNQIAEERVEQSGTVRKLGNIAERAASILGGSGNNIPYAGGKEEFRFISLAKKELNSRDKKFTGGMLEDDNNRIGYGTGGPGIEALREEAPEVVERMGYEEGGSMMDTPMMDTPMMEQPQDGMSSDNEMEKEFLDFILDEALSPEEEEMLMSRLEQDDQLAELFDKVIDVAQEFAGSGPVEGPGSGVSDSIPARLSDGEFVFTAASVEEIGADNLMAMMKDAEMKAEERQGLVEGGMPDEEETVTMKVQEQKEPKVQIAKATVNSTRGLLDEDEISKGIKSKMMLDPNQRHVRS